MIATTYTPDYEIAIKILLSPRVEGGYVNNPNDSGGETNFGITKSALSAYRQDWSIPTLTKDQAREFYFDTYWIPLRLHDFITQELKNVVLATAVNRGIFSAIHSLQVCAGMPKDRQDGKMGPNTVSYVNAEVDQRWLVNSYCDFQAESYDRLAQIWYVKDPQYGWRPVEAGTKGATQKNKVFLNGWINRIDYFHVA